MRLESCPADEDLAAFVDGVIEEPRRGRVVSHLTGCEECREVVVETRRALSEDEPPQVRVSQRPVGRAWLAVAAALVAALAAGVVVRRSEPRPGAESASVAMLAERLRGREAWVYDPPAGAAAFATADRGPRRLAFDLGAFDVDFRVADAAGTLEARAAARERAALLLARLEGGSPIADRLLDEARSIREGAGPVATDRTGEIFDALGLPREWFERGARWEQARLAAVARLRDGLDLESVAADLDRSALPGAAGSARELRALAATPGWRDQEWRLLDRALSGLMQLP